MPGAARAGQGLHWPIADPVTDDAGLSQAEVLERIRSARDQIKARIEALAFGTRIEKPPRTTGKSTPLHELWLEDPDGTLIEIYARLTDAEPAQDR